MSEVNECDDKNLARKVVLKRVFKTADFSRLMDEQKALLKLRSKHVVQLLDVVTFTWRADDITCLVLEYIDGQDLDKITFKPDVKYQKTLWQVASGIAEIHKAGVIHRDIKPPNIRLDTNGVVKIFDFGLARETGKDDKTRSKSGTLGYMAPELWGTTTISFSSAVDTYAFGRTALSLLNVQPHNEKPKAVSSGAIARELPDLDRDLAHIIEGCLEMRPNDRPKMSEVCDLLGRDLLRDKHGARVGINGKMHVLNAGNRTVNIQSAVGSIRINYDGTQFVVANVTGDVYVNNTRVQPSMRMLSACVITIGASGGKRAFVTFDVSNPEIMA